MVMNQIGNELPDMIHMGMINGFFLDCDNNALTVMMDNPYKNEQNPTAYDRFVCRIKLTNDYLNRTSLTIKPYKAFTEIVDFELNRVEFDYSTLRISGIFNGEEFDITEEFKKK